MSAPGPLPGCSSEQDHCITCSDEGVAMRVLRVDAERSLAMCVARDRESVAGDADEEVAIDLVLPVMAGESLLVHAGVALANLGHASPGRGAEASLANGGGS